MLSRFGARIKVVASTVDDEIRCVPGVEIVEGNFRPDDLVQATLVVAATDDSEVNTGVARAAAKQGINFKLVKED